MLVTGIKSKPVYAPLAADTGGRYHLMLGAGVGREPLLRVLGELQAAAPDALARTRVLYVPTTGDATAAGGMQFPGIQELRLFEGAPALLADFGALLQTALMGTRLYVAGPESFIGLAMKIALSFNLNKDEIRAEECGTLARRVHCVHCRAETEDVRTNIVRCTGCGRWLLVRDHYSRRLAAYMGVMVDAEAPGELPPIQEVFT
jgi:DNA-directed RNA polymerase subunit RPC12/RpoP